MPKADFIGKISPPLDATFCSPTLEGLQAIFLAVMASGGSPNNFCSECTRKAWEASWPLGKWVWFPYTLVGLLVGAMGLTITQNWWWLGILTLVAFAATWAIMFVVKFFRAGPQSILYRA